MKNKISAVPYAVIAPLGVLLTAICCVMMVMLPGMLYGQYFGVMYTAAFFVMGRMPLHVLILCVISLPLLLSGILCTVLRKKKAAPWITFAVCTVVFVVLFFVGVFVDTFSSQVARIFGTSAEMIEYYVRLDRQGMIGQSIAALVIYLFSHLCMLPKIRTAAKLVPFVIFFLLTLGLTPVYMLVFAHVLMLPMQIMFSTAAATLTAALPAGLVLLLMGIFMRSKQKHAPREEQPVHEAAPAPVQTPAPAPAPAPVPAEVPVIDDVPTFDERISEKEAAPQPEPEELPHEPGMIFYAKKMNFSMQTVGDWESTTWKIYQNGTVVSYTATVGSNQMPAQRIYQLNREGCVQLATLLQAFPFCDAHHNACDGEGWKMVGYTAQGDVAHHVSGYIYGVAGLEAIAEFLNNGFWEYLQKPQNTEG